MTARRRATEPVEQPEPLNAALRDHVSRYAFVLSLRPTHIAALVHLDASVTAQPAGRRLTDREFIGHDNRPTLKDRLDPATRPMVRLDSHFVSGINGLIARGLVVHHNHPHENWQKDNHRPFGDYYEITSAGRHVIGLLQGSGLWQAYRDSMPWLNSKEAAA